MTEIVTPVPISPMPAAPLLTDTQAVFNTKAFTFVAAWDAFVAQMNALAAATRINAIAGDERAISANTSAASAANSATAAGSARDMAQVFAQSAINAPGTSSTSTTTLTLGTGFKALATQLGKAFVIGQTVTVASATDPTGTRMVGVIQGYDPANGALNVISLAYKGSGSAANWIISLSAARDGLVLNGAGPNQAPQYAISLGLHPSGGSIRASVDGVDFGVILTDAQVLELAPVAKRGEFYRSTPPVGWLKANGAAVSRTTHARLFAVIGTTYGAGDGSTTFNLPNDNGLFPRGWDEIGTYDPGRAFGSIQGPANLSHNHSGLSAYGGAHTPTGTVSNGGGHTPSGTIANSGGHTNTAPQVRSAGGGGATAVSLKSEDTTGAPMNINTVPDHNHTLTMNAVPAHNHPLVMNAVGDHPHVIYADGDTESRPWNRAVLVCIKY